MEKRNYLLLYAKGVAMGAADVVPGVSGGTIAFISGIYDELVDSLKRLNPGALKVLFADGPAAFWARINGSFLTILFAGVLTSVVSLARVVRFALENHPLYIWSFFFGLILASALYIMRRQPHWGPRQLLGLTAGAAAAALCAFASPQTLAATPVAVFFAGMLAICAMILPGISGSFILLLIGIYPAIISAISDFQLSILVVFAAGAALGLMAFSHVLSWLLHHHRATTLSVLIGFLWGSLAVVWPWKQVREGEHGPLPPELLMPWHYEALVGDPKVILCFLLMAAGLVVVFGLEFAGGNLSKKQRLTS